MGLYEYRKDEGGSAMVRVQASWDIQGESLFEVRAMDDRGAYSQMVIWSFTYGYANQRYY